MSIFLESYTLGIYLTNKVFDCEPEITVLETCYTLYNEFFPAKLHISPKDFLKIELPNDFSRKLDTCGSYDNEGLSFVKFHGQNNEEVSILIMNEISSIPSSVTIEWKNANALPSSERLEKLICSFIDQFSAEGARIVCDEFIVSDEIYDRTVNESVVPKAMNWITWLTPTYMKTIGEDKIESIKDIVKVQDCFGGYLVTLMPEPFENDNPKHQAIRKEVEDRLGLTEIYESGGTR